MAVFHSVIKPLYLRRASTVPLSTPEPFYQINFFLARIFPDERFDGLKVEIKVPGPARARARRAGTSALSSDKLLLRLAVTSLAPSWRTKKRRENNGVKFQRCVLRSDFLHRGVHREIFRRHKPRTSVRAVFDVEQM